MDTMVEVRIGDERARVYKAGGIGFDKRVQGIGWVVNEYPGADLARMAVSVRNLYCDELPALTHKCVCGCTADECCEICDDE